MQLQMLEARGPDELESAFAAMTRERPDALFVLADGMFFLHRTRIVGFAAKQRLPTTFGGREDVDAGGLMSYGMNFCRQFQRAAMYAD